MALAGEAAQGWHPVSSRSAYVLNIRLPSIKGAFYFGSLKLFHEAVRIRQDDIRYDAGEDTVSDTTRYRHEQDGEKRRHSLEIKCQLDMAHHAKEVESGYHHDWRCSGSRYG